jgi:hypothetical protein
LCAYLFEETPATPPILHDLFDSFAGFYLGHGTFLSPLWFSIRDCLQCLLADNRRDSRSFAIGELCRYELQAYQGIWALTWRVLAILVVFFLGHAAVDAWGQDGGIAIYGLTIERDIATSSIVVLLALLLIRAYYGLSLEPLHIWIAAGMLLISIIDMFSTSILRNTFTGNLMYWFFGRYANSWSGLKAQIESATGLWNTIRISGDIISISMWCYPLRKPLSAPSTKPVLLPAEVYRDLSPAVNLRLRAFNDRLQGMLKS